MINCDIANPSSTTKSQDSQLQPQGFTQNKMWHKRVSNRHFSLCTHFTFHRIWEMIKWRKECGALVKFGVFVKESEPTISFNVTDRPPFNFCAAKRAHIYRQTARTHRLSYYTIGSKCCSVLQASSWGNGSCYINPAYEIDWFCWFCGRDSTCHVTLCCSSWWRSSSAL